MGRPPRYCANRQEDEEYSTDSDEVHPTEAALKRRLSKQMVVVEEKKAPKKKLQKKTKGEMPLAEKKSTTTTKTAARVPPSKRPRSAEEEVETEEQEDRNNNNKTIVASSSSSSSSRDVKNNGDAATKQQEEVDVATRTDVTTTAAPNHVVLQEDDDDDVPIAMAMSKNVAASKKKQKPSAAAAKKEAALIPTSRKAATAAAAVQKAVTKKQNTTAPNSHNQGGSAPQQQAAITKPLQTPYLLDEEDDEPLQQTSRPGGSDVAPSSARPSLPSRRLQQPQSQPHQVAADDGDVSSPPPATVTPPSSAVAAADEEDQPLSIAPSQQDLLLPIHEEEDEKEAVETLPKTDGGVAASAPRADHSISVEATVPTILASPSQPLLPSQTDLPHNSATDGNTVVTTNNTPSPEAPPPPKTLLTPVEAYFLQFSSRMIRGQLPTDDALQALPFIDVVLEDGSPCGNVRNGAARWLENGFVGATERRILKASIVPTEAEEGLWFAFLVESSAHTFMEVWHAPPSGFPGSPVLLQASPVRKYDVYVGQMAGITDLAWLPLSFPRPGNDSLGLVSFLRKEVVLSMVYPRQNYDSEHLRIEVIGAQSIRTIGPNFIGEPIQVRWALGASHLLDDAFLFVITDAASVAILQPVPSSGSRLALVVSRVLSLRPSSLYSVPSSSSVVTSAASVSSVGQRGLLLTLGNSEGVSMLTYQGGEGGTGGAGGSQQQWSIAHLATRGYMGSQSTTTCVSTLAVLALPNGTVLAAPAGGGLHVMHPRGSSSVTESVNGNNGCPAVTALRSVGPSAYMVGTSAGQWAQVRVRNSHGEIRSVLQLLRERGGGNTQHVLPAGQRDSLRLVRRFDPTIPAPWSGSRMQTALHPLSGHALSSWAVMCFPDGVWAVFPLIAATE